MTSHRLSLPARLAVSAAGALLLILLAFAPPAQAAETCRSYRHVAKVESDPFGTDLAYLHLRQRVCFDGRSITDAGRLVAYPEITDEGRFAGWRWEGFTRRPYSRMKPVRRRASGSRVLYAAGQFSQQVYDYTSTAQVWVKIRVFGNGTARRLALNG